MSGTGPRKSSDTEKDKRRSKTKSSDFVTKIHYSRIKASSTDYGDVTGKPFCM